MNRPIAALLASGVVLLLCGACAMQRAGSAAPDSAADRSAADSSDDPCVVAGRPAASPSGRYLLHAEPGPDDNGVATRFAVVTTAAGERQFVTERPLSLRHGVCFLWSDHDDIAWIGSKDVGLRVYRTDAAGTGWTAADPRQLDPAVVPPLIRANHPHAFE